MMNEMTEILISKYLDSEITPAEQRMLDKALAESNEARAYFEAMLLLKDQSEQVLAEEVLERCQPAETIIAQAFAQADRPRHYQFKVPAWMRVAATIAAGFILGVIALAFWQSRDAQLPEPVEPTVADTQTVDGTQLAADEPVTPSLPSVPLRRRVEYYPFRDRQGEEYLIERYRDSAVAPVGYQGDL